MSEIGKPIRHLEVEEAPVISDPGYHEPGELPEEVTNPQPRKREEEREKEEEPVKVP